MKHISFGLNSSEIATALREVEDYQKSIAKRNHRFIELLTEKGLSVAKTTVAGGSHRMPQLINFSTEVKVEGGKTAGMLMGVGTTFYAIWTAKDNTEQVSEVHPMEMMEFGSGAKALPPQEAFGGYGGQGTFTYSGHSQDFRWGILEMEATVGTPSWVQMKIGTAIEPTRPMYHAMEEIKAKVQEAFEEAFGG